MKIITVEVKNYKSLNQVSIGGFDKVNMIKGLNNSGKSNFLKFLEMIFKTKSFSRDVSSQINDRVLSKREVLEITNFWEGQIFDEPFMFKNNDRNTPITFIIKVSLEHKEIQHFEQLLAAGIATKDHNRPNTLKIEGSIKSINSSDSEINLHKVSFRDIPIFENRLGIPEYFPTINTEEFPELTDSVFIDVLQVLNNMVTLIDSDRYFVPESVKETAEELSPKNFKNWLYELSLNSEKFEEFNNLIKFIGDIKISANIKNSIGDSVLSFPFKDPNVSFSKFGTELEIMLKTKNGRFPLKNYGTGIQQILYLLAKVFSSKSKIILVEELELNLSNDFQELLINNFKNYTDKGVVDQLIFTSHSEVLFRNDFKLFKVKIDKSGNTSISIDRNDSRSKARKAIKEVKAKK